MDKWINGGSAMEKYKNRAKKIEKRTAAKAKIRSKKIQNGAIFNKKCLTLIHKHGIIYPEYTSKKTGAFTSLFALNQAKNLLKKGISISEFFILVKILKERG